MNFDEVVRETILAKAELNASNGSKEETDAVGERWRAAEERMMFTPAPSWTALAQKLDYILGDWEYFMSVVDCRRQLLFALHRDALLLSASVPSAAE